MRRVALFRLAVVVGFLAVAGCGDDDGNDGASVTGLDVTAPTTPSSPGTTGRSSDPTADTTPSAGAAPFVDFPAVAADGVSPAGAGCTPPSTTELPDGQWFGLVEGVDRSTGTVTFDLACLFSGEAANAAAAADGSTDLPVPNDYWIRNASPNAYTLRVVPAVAVARLAEPGASSLAPTESGLDAASVARPGSPWWIEVRSGWVVAMQQQYFP